MYPLSTIGINIDDVVNVVSLVSTELTWLGVFLALAVIITIALIFVKKIKKPLRKLIRGNAWIAFILCALIVVNVMLQGSLNTMVSLAMGEGTLTDASIDQAYDYNEEITGEGITLLENDGLLPLEEGSNLNVFGWASTNPVYGGVGSGAINDKYEITSLLQGLTDAGFVLNDELTSFYTSYKDSRPDVGMWAQDWTLPEPNVSTYSDELISNAKSFSDNALIVISRPGGENADLPWDMTAVVDGSWQEYDDTTGNSYFNGVYDDTLNEGNDWDEGDHYLQLSNREEELIDLVCSNFDNVVLVVNTNNAFELGFVDDYPQIKSVVYCPCPGQNGFEALGQVLDGEVNPSGKTVDIWVKDLLSTPTSNNFGFFQYDNMDEFAYTSVNFISQQEATAIPMFLNYVEGIYVGYRFYETAATEGIIDYDEEVMYPFGYGLSYTDFSVQMTDLVTTDEEIAFYAVVTNTGTVAGKNVVEVYSNPPYINGGIEKSSANLVAFAKTDLLEPGESQSILIEIDLEDLSSYDEYNTESYVLDAGDYILSVNSDSHTILDSRTYTVDSQIVYSEGRPSDETATENRFTVAYGDNVTYLSRADQFANYDVATAAPTDYSMSDANKALFLNNSNYDPTAYNDDSDEMPTMGADNGVVLSDLRGKDYDDPLWDELLDELTKEEMVKLIGSGGYSNAAADSIEKIQCIDCDGPASINNNFTDTGSIGFCGSVMVSSTWNTEMSYLFGDSIGNMADELGVSGWYAPAMNIHRTAFSGRNFEYWSEDGVLSGKMAAAAVEGAWSHGVYAFIKHFALNDQETGRNTMCCVWSCEQAIREIYLKPFEICVKEGGAQAVMTSFMYIGTEWAGAHDGLLNGVLRGEWGFQGMALTDYYGGYGYMDADQAIRNGGDFCLAPYDVGTNVLTDQDSATSLLAARESCKRILYVTVNSRAYEKGNLADSLSTPTWIILEYAISAIVGVLLVVWEFFLIRRYLRERKTV